MAEYRIRYVINRDERGRPIYHSVTVSSDEPPDDDEALQAAFLQESHMYATGEGAEYGDIEVDDIRELAPRGIFIQSRARFIRDSDTGEWIGPMFDGPAHGFRI